MTRHLLLSVRPRFAHALLDGSKTVEVRRRLPAVATGTTVILYSSSPERAVVGTARTIGLVRATPGQIWEDFSDVIGLREEELKAYLDGTERGSALLITDPRRLAKPVALEALRSQLGIDPPQSFRYLDPRQLETITSLGAGAPW